MKILGGRMHICKSQYLRVKNKNTINQISKTKNIIFLMELRNLGFVLIMVRCAV